MSASASQWVLDVLHIKIVSNIYSKYIHLPFTWEDANRYPLAIIYYINDKANRVIKGNKDFGKYLFQDFFYLNKAIIKKINDHFILWISFKLFKIDSSDGFWWDP